MIGCDGGRITSELAKAGVEVVASMVRGPEARRGAT